MAVPKKKTSKSRTRTRHSAYRKKQTTKIVKKIQLVVCTNCGAQKLNHHVCKACGFYNGKQVVDKSKELDSITTVKA
ncbi:50S ribosomal protein L32 [bacterium]|jgi:large subunit ribosomal protein L32|nr:50S ribosomal protein L32 [bacterium]MBT5346768.1 50S ribosomal protein L32 [bacterium]MBT6293714.1 50S ribosomal protein L32 [bacterium]|tara:strand:+ start:2273 stop:2503 length:231 start_codon:yes stop_codon:yes gene_type:complete